MADIRQFQDKHVEQKRCFIVGNGPSLAKMPMELLEKEVSFGMNRISLMFESTTWRPTYFVAVTANIRRPAWKKDILQVPKAGITTFAWSNLRRHFKGIDNKNIHFIQVDQKESFSWDVSQRTTKFGTSLAVAVQLAAYMGFTDIILIGCDLGFTKKADHFHPSYDTPHCLSAKNLNQVMTDSHRMMKRALNSKNIQIRNATPGGGLEVYDRVPFESLFLAKKEN